MTIQQSLETAIRNTFDFRGRASRSEYLAVTLFVYFVVAIFYVVLSAPQFATASTIWGLITFITSLSVSVRRLHDVGISGKWLFMLLPPLVWSEATKSDSIIPVFLFCSVFLVLSYFSAFVASEPHPNRYGLPAIGLGVSSVSSGAPEQAPSIEKNDADLNYDAPSAQNTTPNWDAQGSRDNDTLWPKIAVGVTLAAIAGIVIVVESKKSTRLFFDRPETRASLDGRWERTDYSGDPASLTISRQTKEGFDFTILALSPGGSPRLTSVGELDGSASRFENDRRSFYRAVLKLDDAECQLTFQPSFDRPTQPEIRITQTSDCRYWAGMGVVFGGVYEKR
jgi:uncharacterized membrane protein YhaH (DUF805 family)